MDSDEDGRTNGEELGDPQCVWEEGEVPEATNFQISHPGTYILCVRSVEGVLWFWSVT